MRVDWVYMMGMVYFHLYAHLSSKSYLLYDRWKCGSGWCVCVCVDLQGMALCLSDSTGGKYWKVDM